MSAGKPADGAGLLLDRSSPPERPLDWMDRAACKDAEDPEMFFRGSAEAKRICRRCPVRDECLDFGDEDPYGIWGGERKEGRRSTGHKAGRPRRELAGGTP